MLETSEFSIFDVLFDAVVVVNSSCEILYANKSFSTLLNTSQRRIKRGEPLTQYIDFGPELLPDESISKISQGTPYREIQFKSATGKSGTVQVAIQPLPRPSFVAAWALYIRDVGLEQVLHEKYLAEIEKKDALNEILHAIVEARGQTFAFVGQDGTCTIVSPGFNEMFGLNPNQKDIHRVLCTPNEEAKDFTKWWNSLFESGANANRTRFTEHSHYQNVTVEFIPVLQNSKVRGIIVVGTIRSADVTPLQKSS
jgi:PAS domain-containing protein